MTLLMITGQLAAQSSLLLSRASCAYRQLAGSAKHVHLLQVREDLKHLKAKRKKLQDTMTKAGSKAQARPSSLLTGAVIHRQAFLCGQALLSTEARRMSRSVML